jgi:predicted amidohydrolase YtcJ
MSHEVEIFLAKEIITNDHAMPTAKAVAVMDGRVLHTGTLRQLREDLSSYAVSINDSFVDNIITPGFIEAHCHILEEGALSNFPWIGTYPRRMANGEFQFGCANTDEALSKIKAVHQSTPDRSKVLTCLGWDPNMAHSSGITLDMLDSISNERPIFLLQSNGHIGHCNSAMLQLAGITPDYQHEGVIRDGSGFPTGELRELALTSVLGKFVDLEVGGITSIQNAGVVAQRAGCTTVTDLAYAATNNAVNQYGSVVNEESFPTRIVYAPLVQILGRHVAGSMVDHVHALAERSSNKFGMGPVKFVIDGSIQGRSARLKWPGYCCGDPNGMWLADPDEMFEMMRPFHRAGFQLALHTNGDEAVTAGLDIYERLLLDFPRFDHRHRLEHAQVASEDAFHRMKAFGVCVNLFANHVFYWGETHRRDTVGPAKARTLDACGTALRTGVPFSIHSDAPVTPLDPLFTMWCAVNRRTSEGNVLGQTEKISPQQALRACTIDAAYLLKREGDVGTISVGKLADFTVLSDNPFTIDPMAIKDIAIPATVLAGRVQYNRTQHA